VTGETTTKRAGIEAGRCGNTGSPQHEWLADVRTGAMTYQGMDEVDVSVASPAGYPC
jgi:hypothetical protein